MIRKVDVSVILLPLIGTVRKSLYEPYIVLVEVIQHILSGVSLGFFTPSKFNPHRFYT